MPVERKLVYGTMGKLRGWFTARWVEFEANSVRAVPFKGWHGDGCYAEIRDVIHVRELPEEPADDR